MELFFTLLYAFGLIGIDPDPEFGKPKRPLIWHRQTPDLAIRLIYVFIVYVIVIDVVKYL